MNEQPLHDRATRDMPLTEAEQTALETWYDARDADEAALLERHAFRHDALATLQAEVIALRNQVQDIRQQIARTEGENARIEQDNAALRSRLSPNLARLEGSLA